MSIEKLVKNFKDCEKLPYSIFLNEVIQNIKNPEILAIWVYLSSMPSDWDVNRKQLMNHFSIGERKLKSIISELHQMNLLEYIIEKDDQGRFKSHSAKILCGTKFKKINQSTNAEIDPVDPVVQKTTGAKTARAVLAEHTNKDIYKINKFKNTCPSDDGLLQSKNFEQFWEVYPRKEKKKECYRIWLKIMNRNDENILVPIIIDSLKFRLINDPEWLKGHSRYIPLPTTYLNGERWKDDWKIKSEPKKEESGFLKAIRNAIEGT